MLKDNSTEPRFDDHQADKDIIEFPLLTETTINSVTVGNPVRHSSRVRQPTDRLTPIHQKISQSIQDSKLQQNLKWHAQYALIFEIMRFLKPLRDLLAGH